MKVILWLTFAAMALAADGFDPIRMVQEREAHARRDAEKSMAAVYPAPAKQEDPKRAERLAILDQQIKRMEEKDVSTRD